MATKLESATTNPLQQLATYGQSVWLDYIRRGIITNGELARLLREDGLRGVTSNPAIFEKAIAGSTDYTVALEELQKRGDLDARSEEHTSELQSLAYLVCRLLLEKKKII